MIERPERTCSVCGRRIQWRKKWERNWENVRYCSASCRRQRNDPAISDLKSAILRLLHDRDPSGSICPSEAARAVNPESWKELMEPARRAARLLVASGRVEITQGGRVVDPSTARGPIRIRLR